MKNSLILPDNFSRVFQYEAEKDKLIRPIDEDILISPLKPIKSRKKSNILFQMLFIYDRIVIKEIDFAMSYDISSLNNGPIQILSYDDERKMINMKSINHLSPAIDAEYARYLKPAIIKNITSLAKAFYKIKFDGISDNDFASIMFDTIYCKNNDERTHLIEKYKKVFDYNAHLAWITHGRELEKIGFPRAKEFMYDGILGIIGQEIDSVLLDFAISSANDAIIMNPNYDISKLGVNSENSENVSDIYGILKVECSKFLPMLPSFASLSDVLIYKEKSKKDIKRLREVMGELELILKTKGNNAMVAKAVSSVEKAVNELNQAKSLSKVDKWSLFLSLPIAAIETMTTMPPVLSIPMTLFGLYSYTKQKRIIQDNNWIEVIR